MLRTLFFRLFHLGLRIGAVIVPFPVPKVIKGRGAVVQLADEVRARHLSHVLIVTGNTVRTMAPFARLTDALQSAGIRYTVFSDLQPNPTLKNVEDARQAYLTAGCDSIIAFGGGSPIDCAKIAAARITNDKPIARMAGLFRVWRRIPPLFAVPTTAGTGTEVTIAAVVTDPDKRAKFSVSDPKLIPKVAILDPEVTAGLPPAITAATGMDALTHAVEAYVGVSGNRRTDAYAEKAVRLIFQHLETAYHHGQNLEAREHMGEASYWAGAAFTKASVGYVHAIAHKLGGLYGVAHGLANAIILPHVLDWYGESAHRKLAALARVAGLAQPGDTDATLAQRFIARIRAMNAAMGIPTTVKELQRSDIPLVVESALTEAHPLYPVPRLMTPADCHHVVSRLLAHEDGATARAGS